jgi:hypothetical protein
VLAEKVLGEANLVAELFKPLFGEGIAFLVEVPAGAMNRIVSPGARAGGKISDGSAAQAAISSDAIVSTVIRIVSLRRLVFMLRDGTCFGGECGTSSAAKWF